MRDDAVLRRALPLGRGLGREMLLEASATNRHKVETGLSVEAAELSRYLHINLFQTRPAIPGTAAC